MGKVSTIGVDLKSKLLLLHLGIQAISSLIIIIYVLLILPLPLFAPLIGILVLFEFLLVWRALNAKVIFTDNELKIVNIGPSTMVRYDQITGIDFASGFYFSLYYIALPITSMMGYGKGGFLRLQCKDGNSYELPIFFNTDLEAKMISVLKAKAHDSFSVTSEFSNKLIANYQNLSLYSTLSTIVFVLALIMIGFNALTHNNQLKNEVVLTDGSKMFAYGKYLYNGHNYSEWTLSYPSTYKITQTDDEGLIMSHHVSGAKLNEGTVATIDKNICCSEIRVTESIVDGDTPTQEAIQDWFNYYEINSRFVNINLIKNKANPFWYEKEFTVNGVLMKGLVHFVIYSYDNQNYNPTKSVALEDVGQNIPNLQKHNNTYDIYVIEADTNKENYDQLKPELEQILTSFKKGYFAID